MRLNLTMMITSVSDQKKNSYLTGVNFPHTFLIDISNVAKLYVSIHSIALLRSTAGKKLKENYKKWTEAFSSEYNFNSIQEKYPYLEFKYLYLCTFNNEELPKMIDTFLINGINARIVLALTPYNDKWAYDFGIASNQEIDHLLKIHFDKVLELKGKKLKKILEGRLLNPHYLEEFTIPILPGMDKIKDIPLIIPSKFMLTTSENAINLCKVIDLRTGKELIDATIPIQQINRHLGIFATTGAGKTNLCYHILNQIYPDIPVLIFDWKREYRSLHKMIDAKIYDFIGNNLFYFNPLIPSGEPSQWIKQAANIMAETVGGGVYAGGAFSVYIDVLDSLYRDHGIYDGSTNYPTIFDLLQAI